MIKIDKGMPMPRFRDRRVKYPWADMEVGDSFYTSTSPPSISSARASAQRTFAGRRFTIVKEGEGSRVRRVA